MVRFLFPALLLLAMIGGSVLAETPPAAHATPEAVKALLLGQAKPRVLELAGTPDHMYGVGTTEDVPMNFSQQWVYAPPRSLPVTDAITGAKCKILRVWFDPNDRVEKITFEY